MVRSRTINDLILDSLDFYKTAQPQLDLKPNQVARDLFVEGPCNQLARIYEEISQISSSQSLSQSLGSDLAALAANFGSAPKKGSASSGTALLTFSSIDTDIGINKGDIITSSSGVSFSVSNSTTVSVLNKNTYRAVASKYQADLDYVGITDQYAVEIIVTATTTGSAGNISKYSLKNTTITGVSNVTNPSAFGGGKESETDAAFKRRILGIFSGSNTGTATGYQTTVLADPEVIDAVVVGPGDVLMTRDGTVVNTAADGTQTIVSEGTGGKVDIYVFGFRLTQVINSYIYRDKSNKNDPTNSLNDYVLGQISADAGKSVTKKRIDDIANQVLPDQPVDSIVTVSGTSSGNNFLALTTDSLGRTSGNYQLIKDTGAYSGSPWGFDRLHWIDNQIRNYSEDQTKGKFNSIDPTGFSDVQKIVSSTQNIQIINDNGTVNPSNRTSIQLSHYPITTVTRVFNQTTGERYIVTNQNPDGTGSINNTGRILISGNTLPSTSDILQIDYSWVFAYDPSFDFDNKVTSSNPRSVSDSIDWGYSNIVRREESVVTMSGTQKTVTVTLPVNAIVTINTFSVQISAVVTLINGRLAVAVSSSVTNVISIERVSDIAELYNTGKNNGSFSAFAIFLPTDTIALVGDVVNVRYNATNIFIDSNGISGSFNNNTITIPSTVSVSAGTIVECTYVANITQLLPATALSALPVLRSLNGFTNGSSVVGVQPTDHIYSSGTTILKNLRLAPSRLAMTIAGSISPGVITISGTTFQGVLSAVLPATSSGLTQDLSYAIRKSLGLNSSQTIPSNIKIIKLVSVENVETTSSFDVLSVNTVYDVSGYQIKDNSFVKDSALSNNLLSPFQVVLPATTTNNENPISIGNKLRVTFYISTTGDTENIQYSKSGILYTNKIFAFVDSIYISSGFISASSQVATIAVAPQNQPVQGSRYTIVYNYLAPKANERITITYNKNSVITDNTLDIERTRPIGADVLVKSAVSIGVDASLAIVVQKGFENNSSVIRQNVLDAVTSALNATNLGTTIDSSDLINVAYTVSGVDRVRITRFNKANVQGMVLSIVAASNQFISANTISVIIETR